jgi:thymidylate synthase
LIISDENFVAVTAKSLPEAWENSVLAAWACGGSQPTEYDKPEDENSRDIVLSLCVNEPFAEPRIHKCFPGGLEDLEVYRNEVVIGCHDHWVDGDEGHWKYTYSQRFNNYSNTELVEDQINQLEKAVAKLKEAPHTRRAQAITWKPSDDAENPHCPCVQRIWFRVRENKLDMHLHIRSNDAYKAAFMNMYAFTELQKTVADELGYPVGRYLHFADSFHIYGSYFDEFKQFLDKTENTEFSDRVWNTDFAVPMFIDGCDRTLAEEDLYEDKEKVILERRKYLEGLTV